MLRKMPVPDLSNSLFVVGTLLLASCQALDLIGSQMPANTRNGVIREIVIRDTLSPSVLTANPGDEIRWVNQRQGGAQVVFLDPVEAQLDCQRGFGGWRGANPNQFAADIGANQSASVCFKNRLKARYVIEADSTLRHAERTMEGFLNIEAFSEISGTSGPRASTLRGK